MAKLVSFIKKFRLDVIVIASLLLVSALFFLITALNRDEGAYAEITVDGEVVGKYPLEINATYKLNGGTNELTIENGMAYMTYSTCPDHTCEDARRKAHYVGQTIVCLPNKVSVKILGVSDDSVDFVS